MSFPSTSGSLNLKILNGSLSKSLLPEHSETKLKIGWLVKTVYSYDKTTKT